VAAAGAMVKSAWTAEEDEKLRALIGIHGTCHWCQIAKGVPGRSSKSCRLRWCNQLNPVVNRASFTQEEDAVIVEGQARYGNKWALIARELPGRTDNQIKNRFNSTLRHRRAAGGRRGEPDADADTLSEGSDGPEEPGVPPQQHPAGREKRSRSSSVEAPPSPEAKRHRGAAAPSLRAQVDSLPPGLEESLRESRERRAERAGLVVPTPCRIQARPGSVWLPVQRGVPPVGGTPRARSPAAHRPGQPAAGAAGNEVVAAAIAALFGWPQPAAAEAAAGAIAEAINTLAASAKLQEAQAWSLGARLGRGGSELDLNLSRAGAAAHTDAVH